MSAKTILVFLAQVLCTAHASAQAVSQFPKLTAPYPGQKPPGTLQEIFAPGIIPVDVNVEHSAVVFSPAGDEVFRYTVRGTHHL